MNSNTRTRGTPPTLSYQTMPSAPPEDAAASSTHPAHREINIAQPQKSGKRTRATFKLATLNIRGAAGATTATKWKDINHRMKTDRIALLAVQETHYLTQDCVDALNATHGFRMHISHDGDPDRPNSKGIAIILNKYTTRWREAKTRSIIPGRAMYMTLPWHGNSALTVLAVYAPNTPSKNESFWRALQSRWEDDNLPPPDIVLGDFNVVEEAIDRKPAHIDEDAQTEALDSLKESLGVSDAWRAENPYTSTYTWEQSPNSGPKSRIDRIYMSPDLAKHTVKWNTDYTEIPTDHKMVSVKIYNSAAPFIGRGRWYIPLHLLHDKDITTLIRSTGTDTLKEMSECAETHPDDPTYAQHVYKRWKQNTVKSIRNMARSKIPRLNKRIIELKNKAQLVRDDSSIPEEDKNLLCAEIDTEWKDLVQIRYQQARQNLDISGHVNRECIRKPWINENKEKSPHDTLQMLKVPRTTPPQYVTRTADMLDLATAHHDELQRDNPHSNVTHTKEVMEPLKVRLTPQIAAMLELPIGKKKLKMQSAASPTGKQQALMACHMNSGKSP